jgi:hypothetical protein
MNGTIHTTAAKQYAVGRIHNGINFQPGNIAGDYFNHFTTSIA